MATERLSMRQTRESLRQKWVLGRPYREVAVWRRLLGVPEALASEFGSLCHGDGAQGRAPAAPRQVMLAIPAGLVDGRLATTATDEYTVHKAYKLAGSTIETVCGGHNGIETRMPVAFTKFVAERKMPLTRFVDITSANAARILGLYPQKGAIQPGSDADLVLIDPTVRKTIALADLHADADYSIWEGFACQGYPVMTILRGKVIVEHGKLVGSSSDGRWVERRVSGDVLGRPAV